jgi:hypothetical protein
MHMLVWDGEIVPDDAVEVVGVGFGKDALGVRLAEHGSVEGVSEVLKLAFEALGVKDGGRWDARANDDCWRMGGTEEGHCVVEGVAKGGVINSE